MVEGVRESQAISCDQWPCFLRSDPFLTVTLRRDAERVVQDISTSFLVHLAGG